MAGLDAPLSDFWFFVAEPPNTTKEPCRYIPANIYWFRTKEGPEAAHFVTLNELLGDGILARFYREHLRQVAKAIRGKGWRPAVLTARGNVVANHWPLVESKCRELGVPKAERADAIQACMARLCTVYEDWDASTGVPFGAFAEQPIEWEIQDYLKRLRKQVPVQRSINLNDPANNFNRDDDDDKPPDPERPDMMTINSLETQAAEAKRRVVAERLGCLNPRERRVIEGILGLNGYKYPVKKKEIAIELGLTAARVGQIEAEAAAKLRKALL